MATNLRMLSYDDYDYDYDYATMLSYVGLLLLLFVAVPAMLSSH